MASRLVIGVDVDGVLSDFLGLARHLSKALHGKPADDVVQTTWGFDSLGLTKEEEDRMWRTIDASPNWWIYHKRMPGTQLVKKLCDKHRVVFITNRKDGTGMPVETQTALWLQETFGIAFPTVLLSNKKGPLAKGLMLDAFIDDRPKNIEEVIAAHTDCQTAILRTTYNATECLDVPEVKTFDEFAKRYL